MMFWVNLQKKKKFMNVVEISEEEARRTLTIDVDKIIAAKSNGKRVPRFVANYLKRTIHQDDINEYIVYFFK